jgi:hypothetical protein
VSVFSEHAFQFSLSCLEEKYICLVFVFMSKKNLVTTNDQTLKTFEFSLECLSEDSPTKTLQSSSHPTLIKIIRSTNSLCKQLIHMQNIYLQKEGVTRYFSRTLWLAFCTPQDLWTFTARQVAPSLIRQY